MKSSMLVKLSSAKAVFLRFLPDAGAGSCWLQGIREVKERQEAALPHGAIATINIDLRPHLYIYIF